jgi:uncharacterized membrane protein
MFTFEQIIFDFAPILFALAGFAVAFYVHHKKKTNMPMVCPLKGNCDTVTRSRYSTFLGVPVEKIGMLYYALVLIVYILNNVLAVGFPDVVMFLMIGITMGAFVFSLYLTFIQAFLVRSWCTWCLLSAGFSSFIFITALFGTHIDIVVLLKNYKTLIIVLHALAGAVGLGAATVSDVFFFKFMKDYRVSASEHEMVKTLSNVIWCALGLIIITGIGLFIPKSDVLLMSSKFLIKMTGVSVLVLNGLVLNMIVSPRLMDITFNEEHEHRSGELHVLRKLSFASGAISIVTWYTVFTLGLFPKIPVDYRTALLLYVLLLCFAVLCSQVMDRRMVRNYQKAHALSTPNEKRL